jgi:hypothetical protein
MPAAGEEDQASRDDGNGVSAWSTYAEQVAANMLNRDGLAPIWQLHLSAAEAHREGNTLAGRYILDIADAAERVWLQRSIDNRTGCPQRQG